MKELLLPLLIMLSVLLTKKLLPRNLWWEVQQLLLPLPCRL